MKEQISENYKLQEVVFEGKYEDNNILPSPSATPLKMNQAGNSHAINQENTCEMNGLFELNCHDSAMTINRRDIVCVKAEGSYSRMYFV